MFGGQGTAEHHQDHDFSPEPSSCLDNPDLLVSAPVGTSASCPRGSPPPALVGVVVAAPGGVDVDVPCTAGFSATDTVVGPGAGVIPPFEGTCTLTITSLVN